MADTSAIVVQGLTKAFKNLQVLKGIDFVIERGTMLALLGPNGAGKTTTIHILSTLLQQDSGTALVNGYDTRTQAHKVRESIGLTGQYAAVDEYLTGMENLEMMGRLYHLSIEDTKRRSRELLEQFDLLTAAHRAVKTYSGGMRRRLDLAASLIATPPILFLDEPTTGLDPTSRLAMWESIKKLVEADVTILLTTQHLEEADLLADSIAVLNDGAIIVQGTSEQLKARVGRERLELTIQASYDFEKAVQSLAREVTHQDARSRTITVTTDGNVQEIQRILNRMQQAHIEIETMSLHKPTLDDVFMHFTGHTTEQEKTNRTPA